MPEIKIDAPPKKAAVKKLQPNTGNTMGPTMQDFPLPKSRRQLTAAQIEQLEQEEREIQEMHEKRENERIINMVHTMMAEVNKYLPQMKQQMRSMTLQECCMSAFNGLSCIQSLSADEIAAKSIERGRAMYAQLQTL